MNLTPKLAHFELEAEDAKPQDMTIKMNGKPLQGCKEIILRAGLSGYTNVCVEMDAPISVDVVAAYFANVDIEDNPFVVTAVREGIQEAVNSLPNDYEHRDYLARMFGSMDTDSNLKFVSSLLSTLRSQLRL